MYLIKFIHITNIGFYLIQNPGNVIVILLNTNLNNLTTNLYASHKAISEWIICTFSGQSLYFIFYMHLTYSSHHDGFAEGLK